MSYISIYVLYKTHYLCVLYLQFPIFLLKTSVTIPTESHYNFMKNTFLSKRLHGKWEYLYLPK